jgi:hypothetical protein
MVTEMRIARGVFGFMVGYAFVVLVTEFGFRLLPGGRASLAEGAAQIIYATVVAVAAGAGGGALGALIARNRVAGALIAVPLIMETFWLFFLKKPPEERTLFEVGGAVALIACTFVGAYAAQFVRRASSPRPS